VWLFSLAYAAPCNFGVFAGACDRNEDGCPWYCWTVEDVYVHACYTNASQCCYCKTRRWKCDCPLGTGYAYNDQRFIVPDATCDTLTGKCIKNNPDDPPGG
jgi:hypothetical protein